MFSIGFFPYNTQKCDAVETLLVGRRSSGVVAFTSDGRSENSGSGLRLDLADLAETGSPKNRAHVSQHDEENSDLDRILTKSYRIPLSTVEGALIYVGTAQDDKRALPLEVQKKQ